MDKRERGYVDETFMEKCTLRGFAWDASAFISPRGRDTFRNSLTDVDFFYYKIQILQGSDISEKVNNVKVFNLFAVFKVIYNYIIKIYFFY